ncbi:hypothetical protein NE237_009899 [Protea cynaroides]|uniref:Uncharacterized protein n=1 Tax=Protea cynaroides TaxID=273540 RepID=A0A9Q0KZG0_9MAGN|nr:hypothetical protein NE237_009899 [Protea cynaroides]
MTVGGPNLKEVMVKCSRNGHQCFFKQVIEYEDPPPPTHTQFKDCGTFGHRSGACKGDGNVPSANNESGPDQVDAKIPVPFKGPKEVRPSGIPKLISPSRAIVGSWADVEDDDDFGVEDGELQGSKAVSSQMVPSSAVIASSPGQVEVVYDDILVVDEALQGTVGLLQWWESVIVGDQLVGKIRMGLMLSRHLMCTMRILL